MTKCPSCFTTLMPEYMSWICLSNRCAPEPDEIATAYGGFQIASRPIMNHIRPPRTEAPASVPCRVCNESTAARVCPYCHYGPLPADWFSSDTTCVAMAGARYTGKSFYLCVAIKQLQQLGSRIGTAVDFADDRSKANFQRHYEGPLFTERGIIQPTPAHDVGDPPQRYPMVLSLGVRRGRRQYLVFRDLAGEDLERDRPNDAHLRFLAHADSVIFMFDPLGVSSITDMFPGLVDQQQTGGDPQVVLNNVLRIIGPGRPLLGVVLAKFDTLERLREVERTTWSEVMSNTGAAMLRDSSSATAAYDTEDGERLHEEVRSMLTGMQAHALITALERPTNGNRLSHRYFATSVLGESVRGDKLASRGVAPFRCLDPLRWVLAQTGAL